MEKNTNRKKILFLASWYPNQENQLSGIFIKRHAKSVLKKCDLVVLYIHYNLTIDKTYITNYYDEGIKTIIIYPKSSQAENQLIKKIYNLFYQNSLINGIRGTNIALKELGKPDIVHVNVILPMGIIALLLRILLGIPYVITEHSSPFSVHTDKLFNKFLCKTILSQAKYILPVSSGLRNQIMNVYKHTSFKVIPNVIDTSIFKPTPNPKEISKIKKILHVSLLNDEQKNISGILHALAKISRYRDDFQFNIIGEGKDLKKLIELSKNLKLFNKGVFFHGKVSNETLAEYFKESDFFILNSYHETFAVVCAEALASGIPVIATKSGGPEDYINDLVGILIEPGNERELIEAIENMLDNYYKYDKSLLSNYANEKFGCQKIGNDFFSIYQKILNESY